MDRCIVSGCAEEHDIFIFTEIYGCGEIGKVFVESYITENLGINDLPIHVFGYKQDLDLLPDSKQIIKARLRPFNRSGIEIVNESSIKYLYKRGHAGTALLWTYLIRNVGQKYLIHIDSDTIILGDIVSEIATILRSGETDLVGPVRPYKSNSQGIIFDEESPDLVQTCIFGFNRELINLERPLKELFRMVLGTFSPTNQKILDFFDPVSMEIIVNQGKVHFLDHDDVGGLNRKGSRRNRYAALNDFPTKRKIDVGAKFIHFSAVGSGVNVYKNPKNTIPGEYAEYALDRFALYSKIFMGDNLGRSLDEYVELIDGLTELLNKK